MPVAVDADELLRELDRVWTSLGKDQSESGGVLRACAMTLIALLDDQPQPADIGETLADLMHDHPSRTIVVKVTEQAKDLSARAFAQCWMPFGRQQQICSEQIEITSPAGSLGDVPAVLRGLVAPDLPVALWVRNAGLIEHPITGQFVDLAQKLIIESKGCRNWRQLITRLQHFSESGKAVADLAWTRITRWRQLIAQIFEDPDRTDLVGNIDEVIIRHSSPEPGPAESYLGAWVLLSLPREAGLRYEQSGETRTWQIQQLELRGSGVAISARRAERHAVEIHANSFHGYSAFRQLKEADLLREELSIPGRDPVFVRVLASL